ncbi:MAG TPA: GNAT family N-acetyltransferase [Pirellulaceae bacterium]|jgi:ribosomal protein S18 acetylase RimI-like enzyme|nr:GNAT family N-acetyltransferase [Pirellulaceae bacterium]
MNDPLSDSLSVRPADLANPADAESVVAMLDAYARDPLGMSAPLPDEIRSVLIDRLQEVRHWIGLAWLAERPVGVAICFFGFSTFRARPLLNLHDFAVVPEARGLGVGKTLMDAVLAAAKEHGCCKVTLEVRSDNGRAKRLYAAAGFSPLDTDGDASFEFWKRDVD